MNSSDKRQMILSGNMNKVLLTLAAPIMLNNLIQTIYNLTDTWFVGQIDEIYVGAITLVWPVIFFVMALGLGIAAGGSTLISQYIGSEDYDKATKISGQMIFFSIVFSIIFGILGYLLAPTLVSLFGAEDKIYHASTTFLKIILAGMPTMFLMFSYNSIRQGFGDTFKPMIIGGLSVGLNILLDPIFIFVFNLGIAGAAYATVLARGIFAIYAISTLFKSTSEHKLHINDLRPDRILLKEILRIGLPSSIGQSTAALGFSVLNFFIISYGDSTITAFGIGNRINSLVLMPAMGIGNALIPIIGQNLGADNLPRAKEAIKQSAILSTVFLVIGGCTIFLLSESIVRQFAESQHIVDLSTNYLHWISAGLPLMGFFQILIGVFQGSGHTKSAMIITMGRLWLVRIPLIILFKTFTAWESNGVWYAMVLSNAIICIVGFSIFKTGRWQKKII
ncbi:MAG: MATE family efflux transporter [Tissierellales bacterium]|nr:MATE family efflux transporter [Tissierellales bacterium]